MTKTKGKMTRAAVKNLRTKELKELKTFLDKKRLELAKIQVKILSGKEKNLKAAKFVKKEIAQLLTILKERSQDKPKVLSEVEG